jgi:hypothetical protein
VTYDAQCEDERAPYLWRLIQLSKQQAFFRTQVLRLLSEGHADSTQYDWAQLFGLARRFAAAGGAEMRRALYAAFEQLGFETAGLSSAAELIALDGFDGFVFAACRFDRSHPDNEVWMVSSLVGDLEDRMGKEQAAVLMAEAARENARLAAVVETVREFEEKIEEENAQYKALPRPSYVEFKNQSANSSWASALRRWATGATPKEIQMAGEDFLSGAEEEKVWGFLRILNRRAYPGNPERLLALADDERPRIRRAAVVALSNVAHPEVRRRAQDLLKTKDRFGDGARLLVSNYEPGDFTILEGLLRQVESDDDVHDVGFSVQSILEKTRTTDAERSLLLLYEKTPCSNCRRWFVRLPAEMKKIPDWMRAECLYDANGGTVEVVERDVKVVEKG